MKSVFLILSAMAAATLAGPQFWQNKETAVEARQFSEDPIINYAGWGFIAGLADYFIRQALTDMTTTTTTTTTAAPRKAADNKKEKKQRKERKQKKAERKAAKMAAKKKAEEEAKKNQEMADEEQMSVLMGTSPGYYKRTSGRRLL